MKRFSHGRPLEISVCDEVVQIEAVPVKFRLEQRGFALVLVPEEEMPPMTAEDFELVVEFIVGDPLKLGALVLAFFYHGNDFEFGDVAVGVADAVLLDESVGV